MVEESSTNNNVEKCDDGAQDLTMKDKTKPGKLSFGVDRLLDSGKGDFLPNGGSLKQRNLTLDGKQPQTAAIRPIPILAAPRLQPPGVRPPLSLNPPSPSAPSLATTFLPYIHDMYAQQGTF